MLQPRNKVLYKKAFEILKLSRSISAYLVHDLAPLQNNGNENPFVYFTGDIIRQSDSLVPIIKNAESQVFQDDRIKYANSLINHTNKLYKNCKRLEKSDSNGIEFIALLRKELRKFKRLQRNWMMSL